MTSRLKGGGWSDVKTEGKGSEWRQDWREGVGVTSRLKGRGRSDVKTEGKGSEWQKDWREGVGVTKRLKGGGRSDKKTEGRGSEWVKTEGSRSEWRQDWREGVGVTSRLKGGGRQDVKTEGRGWQDVKTEGRGSARRQDWREGVGVSRRSKTEGRVFLFFWRKYIPTRPKHIKDSKECYLLGQLLLCILSVVLNLLCVWILFQNASSHSRCRFFLNHDMIYGVVFYFWACVSVECEEWILCLGRQFRFAPWENCVDCMDSSQ